MKKTISLFLSIALIFTLTVPALAADSENRFVLLVDQAVIPPGGVVTVTLSLDLKGDGPYTIYGINDYIRYDPDIWEPVGGNSSITVAATSGNKVTASFVNAPNSGRVNAVYVSCMNGATNPIGITKEQTKALVSFQLRVKPGITSGTYYFDNYFAATRELQLESGENMKFEPEAVDTQVSIGEWYPITIDPAIKNCRLTANPNPALSGSTVTLTAQPDSGYVLKGCSAKDESGNPIPVNADGTFNMPNRPVTVSATVEQAPTGGGGIGGGGAVEPPADNAISVTPAAGGKVISSLSSAPKGTKITLTVTPDSGYRTSGVQAAAAGGAQIGVSLEPDGSCSFIMPDSGVTVTATFAREPALPSVSGVSEWLNYTDHIAYISGYEDATVRPLGSITRAETAMMLYRLLLQPKAGQSERFKDVSEGAWYADAVNALAEMGIITGYEDGSFYPNRQVTRAEFTAMVTRFAKSTQGTVRFEDVPETHWAVSNIATAAGYGWITGYADGTFRPSSGITRAESATILNRVLNRTADVAYVTTHASELKQFTDLKDNTRWYFYDMVEASNAHDQTPNGMLETWTRLR